MLCVVVATSPLWGRPSIFTPTPLLANIVYNSGFTVLKEVFDGRRLAANGSGRDEGQKEPAPEQQQTSNQESKNLKSGPQEKGVGFTTGFKN